MQNEKLITAANDLLASLEVILKACNVMASDGYSTRCVENAFDGCQKAIDWRQNAREVIKNAKDVLENERNLAA